VGGGGTNWDGRGKGTLRETGEIGRNSIDSAKWEQTGVKKASTNAVEKGKRSRGKKTGGGKS